MIFSGSQLPLPWGEQVATDEPGASQRARLARLLKSDLDFHDQASDYASHNFHSFPAKFPPQLPRVFIEALTERGQIVLDPMVGSGTTVLEALLAARCGIGVDIDPLALLLSHVKSRILDAQQAARAGLAVLSQATELVMSAPFGLDEELEHRFDAKTRAFIDYWFAKPTQRELLALVREIERLDDQAIRAFLMLTFSSIIVTKSGGVSWAADLAHTRPHLVQDKVLRSALTEFEKRLRKNLRGLAQVANAEGRAAVIQADAQSLPLASNSVDLIVTSPPYASNAIDYMRAHKFSLVWLGYPSEHLSAKRQAYIGGEALQDQVFEPLPAIATERVSAVAARDRRKGAVLKRYYSEMMRCLREMYRVLKPGKAAVVVVGTSLMREVDTRTQECLADIGASLGFEVVGIATRRLDRDRRMMPARKGSGPTSQIEQRMHEEYVIGFLKPESQVCNASVGDSQ